MRDPQFTFVFEVRVEVAPAVPVGVSPEAVAHNPGGAKETLHFVAITGGTVSGPRISGEVMPGGGDWYVDRAGVAELNARYLLRTSDDAVIDIENRGFWKADEATTARLDAGEFVDESEYYYRTSARFRTAAPGFEWLTESVVIGLARQEGSTICIRFFTLD